MQRNRRWRLVSAGLILLASASVAWAEPRTWSDNSGKFEITADLVAIQHGNVVLRTDDGRQLTVPVKKLSASDRAFVEGLESPVKSQKRGGGKGAELVEVANNFFNELRSEKREVAGEMLTTKAMEVLEGGKSPLAGLPAPEEGDRAVRVGRPKIDEKVAEVPVQVKAGGAIHKTKLHFRQEEEQWRIFAMSAMYPDGEKSINLEAEVVAEGEGDPLEALVGKPFAFTGMTLDGKPLDLSRYQGKVVLVDFWATWCGPCIKEMPNIFANYQKYGGRGFDVIGVSVDEDLNALSEYVTKQHPPWAIVADRFPGNPQPMGSAYKINAIPSLILVGPDGKVAAVNCRGPKLGEELEKIFAAAGQGQQGAAQPGADQQNAGNANPTQ